MSIISLIIDDVYSLTSSDFFKKFVISVNKHLCCEYVLLSIDYGSFNKADRVYTACGECHSNKVFSSEMLDHIKLLRGYSCIKDVKNKFTDDGLVSSLISDTIYSYVVRNDKGECLSVLVVIGEDSDPVDKAVKDIIRFMADRLRLEIENELLITEISEKTTSFEKSRDYNWIIDKNCLITDINKLSADIYKYNPSEMYGIYIPSLMRQKDGADFLKNMSLVSHGKEINKVMAEIIRKDCSVINIMYSLKPRYSKNGEYIGAIGSISDVAEPVVSTTEIESNSDIFSEILAKLPVVFFRMDSKGVIINIRGNGLARMGVEDVDWVGKHGCGLFLGMDKLLGLSMSGETVNFESKGSYGGNPWWFNVSMFFDSWTGSGALGFAVDISEQKIGERKLVDLLKLNRELAQKLIVVQEEERRALSRELHDELGQSITAVKSLARVIASSAGAACSESRSLGYSIIGISANLYEVVNDIMQRLRPDVLDNLSFQDTISSCISQSHLEKTGVTCDVQYVGDLDGIDEIIQITIYRIVQECLTNISKHSMASNVFIKIERKTTEYIDGRFAVNNKVSINKALHYIERDVLVIVISDDGIGMGLTGSKKSQSSGSGKGLQGMKERVMALGGFIKIKSKCNNGTTINVVLDLKTKITDEPVKVIVNEAGAALPG